ncbi:hypothetical protein BDE02_13G133300 [Populus trichocarpa]|nr:hypothetical protein BDE02_13G133300 [Populus trichocarpa]
MDTETQRQHKLHGREDRRGGREESGHEVYGKGRFELFNSDGKRKRVYADQYGDWEATNNRKVQNTKALAKKGHGKVKDVPVKSKSVSLLLTFSLRYIWISNRLEAATSETKRSSSKAKHNSAQVSSSKWSTKANEANKFDDDRNGLLNNETKNKFDSSKRSTKMKEIDQLDNERNDLKWLDQSRSKHSNVSPSFPIKKRSTIERKAELEEDAGMSKNAQFRAIQPSPSILSYVEDNFLGRRRLIELKRAGYNADLSAPLDNIPFSTSSERERIEENIFRNKLTFFAAAKVSSSFPPPGLPEIAFAGRSSVGKSSLLNSLTRQWGVARTSMMVSSKSGAGLRGLRTVLSKVARFAKL